MRHPAHARVCTPHVSEPRWEPPSQKKNVEKNFQGKRDTHMCLLRCLKRDGDDEYVTRIRTLEQEVAQLQRETSLQRLWKGLDVARKEDVDTDECLVRFYECKICMNAPLQVALLPCGHVLSCKQCAARLQRCPACGQTVRQLAHLFWT